MAPLAALDSRAYLNGHSPETHLKITIFPQSSRIAVFFPSPSTHIRSQSLGKRSDASLQPKFHEQLLRGYGSYVEEILEAGLEEAPSL